MKVEVTLLGFTSLICLMVSVDIKQHCETGINVVTRRAQELCESRGGCRGLPVPNTPYGFCGRNAGILKRAFVAL